MCGHLTSLAAAGTWCCCCWSTRPLSPPPKGASVIASGQLVASPGSKQAVEIKADKLTLVGGCEQEAYPLQKVSRGGGAERSTLLTHLSALRTDKHSSIRAECAASKWLQASSRTDTHRGKRGAHSQHNSLVGGVTTHSFPCHISLCPLSRPVLSCPVAFLSCPVHVHHSSSYPAETSHAGVPAWYCSPAPAHQHTGCSVTCAQRPSTRHPHLFPGCWLPLRPHTHPQRQ